MARHEQVLAQRLRNGLAEVPGLELLTLWEDAGVDRVGVAAFNLDGYRHPLVASILSAEYAIGVRHGCFCAHPPDRPRSGISCARLLGTADAEVARLRGELDAGRRPPLPGAVRASIGLGTTVEDIDLLLDALDAIAVGGPRGHYEHVIELDEYRRAATPPARGARAAAA